MSNFTPNGNWDRTFNSPGGMVGKYLVRKARHAGYAALVFVGVDTGKLKMTIDPDRKARRVGPQKLDIHVHAGGPSADYALAHHQGFSAHRITNSDGVMAFPKGGRVVYTSSVNHPGFGGNPFLTEALKVAMEDEVALRRHRGDPW